MSTQRTAVVTGAKSGFGRLTAEAFAADGWRVYATMREVDGRNAKVAAELRAAGVLPLELDVTSDASVDVAAAAIHAQAGAVDVLVNNAGIAFMGILEAFTPAQVEEQFATNVIGPLRVNRAFLPAMRERRSGLVVYLSSGLGRLAWPYSGVYGASKFALEALAETSSYELAPFGIDVAVVEPGAFPTEIISSFVGPEDAARIAGYGPSAEAARERIDAISTAAQGRDPKEVALTILHLANAPAGTRPLRTTVPVNPAVDQINAAVAPIQRKVIENLGLAALLGKAPA